MSETPSESTEFQSDNVQRFIFDNAPVRGEWVHLTESWQQIISRREYPKAIQGLLGKMVAAVALLTATVKIKGRLILQIKSSGPVTLMMVECTSNNTLRAFVEWQANVADDATLIEITGDGLLTITINVEGSKQPYQGIVSLQGNSISAVLETYFKQSEQLETRIWLSADRHAVAGLFLQQLPSKKTNEQDDKEHWSRLSQLAATVSDKELLGLGARTLLHRLFHEEECRLLSATELAFSCNCSRERVSETISLLGEHDANELLAKQGIIEVACELCNEHYQFNEQDIKKIFLASHSVVTSSESTILH